MDSSESLSPGNFSQIHLRLWDTWAQISLTSTKTRLRGSLNPDIIEEITHALGYVSSVPRCVIDDPSSTRLIIIILFHRYRGVLITGVGNVFCQGVDLHFLCADHQDRRKAQAALMAAAVERLVISLSTFPKLLVAAVNGDASGLGVTLLPLFDIVYANDKATFNTYYSRYKIILSSMQNNIFSPDWVRSRRAGPAPQCRNSPPAWAARCPTCSSWAASSPPPSCSPRASSPPPSSPAA